MNLLRLHSDKKIFINVIASGVDKGLPVIIALIISNFIDKSEFGMWATVIAYITIFTTAISTPLITFFSKNFFKKVYKKNIIDNAVLNSLIIISSILIFVNIFPEIVRYINPILIGGVILSIVIFQILVVFLRFNGKDLQYLVLSIIRLTIFSISIFIYWFVDEKIILQELFISYFIAHIIPCMMMINLLKNNFKVICFVDNQIFGEHIRLIVYGVSTSLLAGVDRVVASQVDFDYDQLGNYAYSLTFALIPSFIVEGCKQYYSPRIFSDLTKKGKYNKNLVNEIFITLLILSFIQLFLPIITLILLDHVGLFSSQYILNKNFIHLTLLCSIGLLIYNIYHFINPIFFFYDRSILLLIIQSFSIIIFSLIVFKVDSLSEIKLASYRILLSFIVVISLILLIIIKPIKNKYVSRNL